MRGNPLNVTEIEEIKRYAKEGMIQSEIAKKSGRSLSTVTRILNKKERAMGNGTKTSKEKMRTFRLMLEDEKGIAHVTFNDLGLGKEIQESLDGFLRKGVKITLMEIL